MTEIPICPRCKKEMEEKNVSRTYGNPITIEKNVHIFTCSECSFEVISEDEYEKIRKHVEQSKNTNAKIVIF